MPLKWEIKRYIGFSSHEIHTHINKEDTVQCCNNGKWDRSKNCSEFAWVVIKITPISDHATKNIIFM